MTKDIVTSSNRKKKEFEYKTIQIFQDVKEDFKTFLEEKEIEYYRVGTLDKGPGKNFYYKYMDLETALLCLKSKKLRFSEPSEWQDKYERRFYNAKYDNVLSDNIRSDICPIFYANCFTIKNNNEAAWKIYTHGKQGLGSRCVKIKLNRMNLRKQLITNLKNGCLIYEGLISYVNEETINNLHKHDNTINPYYDSFFNPFDRNAYFNLMLLKRESFEHEHEARIMIMPKNPNISLAEKNKKYIEVTMDWQDIIKEVKYEDSCSNFEIELLTEAVRKAIDFQGSDKEWKNHQCCPTRYHVYGKYKRISIEK